MASRASGQGPVPGSRPAEGSPRSWPDGEKALGGTHEVITYRPTEQLLDNNLARSPKLRNLSSTSTFRLVFEKERVARCPGKMEIVIPPLQIKKETPRS